MYLCFFSTKPLPVYSSDIFIQIVSDTILPAAFYSELVIYK